MFHEFYAWLTFPLSHKSPVSSCHGQGTEIECRISIDNSYDVLKLLNSSTITEIPAAHTILHKLQINYNEWSLYVTGCGGW